METKKNNIILIGTGPAVETATVHVRGLGYEPIIIAHENEIPKEAEDLPSFNIKSKKIK